MQGWDGKGVNAGMKWKKHHMSCSWGSDGTGAVSHRLGGEV